MDIIKLISHKFNNIKIRNKLLISYLIVVTIPVMLVGVFLTQEMKDSVLKNSINNAVSDTNKLETRIQQLLTIPVDTSERMFMDDNLFKLVSTRYKYDWEAVAALNKYTEFGNLMSLNSEIGSIRLYVTNDTLINNWQIILADKDIQQSRWYKKAMDNYGGISWEYMYDLSQKCNTLCLTRMIYDENMNKIGVLVLGLRKQYIKDIINEEQFETHVSVDNNIFLSNNFESTKNLLTKPFLERINTNDKIVSDIKLNGIDTKMIQIKFNNIFQNGNFAINTFIPISKITKDYRKASTLGLAIMLISLLLAGVFIVFFSNAVSGRLNKLSRQMRKVVQEDFNIDVPIEVEGEDEIGQLSMDLSIMVKNIQRLVNEIYDMVNQQKELAIRQKDIEFKMLANQINPHFLYNALETIRMKCQSKGDTETANIVKLFAKLMRRNLEVSNASVTLLSELEFVKNYLEIQKFRFEGKVDYIINVLCDINDYKIIPLLIQPIVENAFVHGLEVKAGAGAIVINIELIDDIIDISVIDDGKGIEENKLKAMNDMLENGKDMESKRIGLYNVNRRIKLFYGNNYGIKIISSIDFGTRIDILLPKNLEEYDYAEVINN